MPSLGKTPRVWGKSGSELTFLAEAGAPFDIPTPGMCYFCKLFRAITLMPFFANSVVVGRQTRTNVLPVESRKFFPQICDNLLFLNSETNSLENIAITVESRF